MLRARTVSSYEVLMLREVRCTVWRSFGLSSSTARTRRPLRSAPTCRSAALPSMPVASQRCAGDPGQVQDSGRLPCGERRQAEALRARSQGIAVILIHPPGPPPSRSSQRRSAGTGDCLSDRVSAACGRRLFFCFRCHSCPCSCCTCLHPPLGAGPFSILSLLSLFSPSG